MRRYEKERFKKKTKMEEIEFQKFYDFKKVNFDGKY